MRNTSKISNRLNMSFTYCLPQKLLFLLKLFSLITLKSLAVLGVSLIISFSAFYIFQITGVISDGYQIQNYQKKINELLAENKILEVNYAKINSLKDIDGKIEELGFEKMNKVYYIQLFESSVVTTPNKIE